MCITHPPVLYINLKNNECINAEQKYLVLIHPYVGVATNL